jgi:hypothetical protein
MAIFNSYVKLPEGTLSNPSWQWKIIIFTIDVICKWLIFQDFDYRLAVSCLDASWRSVATSGRRHVISTTVLKLLLSFLNLENPVRAWNPRMLQQMLDLKHDAFNSTSHSTLRHNLELPIFQHCETRSHIPNTLVGENSPLSYRNQYMTSQFRHPGATGGPMPDLLSSH